MSNFYPPSSYPSPHPNQSSPGPYQPSGPYTQPPSVQRPYFLPRYSPVSPVFPRRRIPWKLLFGCLTLSLIALCSLPLLAGMLLSFLSPKAPTSVNEIEPTPRPMLPPLKVYRVIGKPMINAQFINSVLDYYNSPAKGKGQVLYEEGVKYGVDPSYALAFFLEESSLGTRGVATVTHALGNIRANAGEPQYNGYRSYGTWEEGFIDWYQLIAHKYVATWHLSTVEQIVPVYAPAEDHNDEDQYIHTIKLAIERWRNGYVDV